MSAFFLSTATASYKHKFPEVNHPEDCLGSQHQTLGHWELSLIQCFNGDVLPPIHFVGPNGSGREFFNILVPVGANLEFPDGMTPHPVMMTQRTPHEPPLCWNTMRKYEEKSHRANGIDRRKTVKKIRSKEEWRGSSLITKCQKPSVSRVIINEKGFFFKRPR